MDKQEIETLGIFFEQRDMTPMEARVFALLLLSDPPYQDFYRIRELLGSSKSSVSNALNRLMSSRRVDYLTLPGDRKRYFKVNPQLWLEEMKRELAAVAPMQLQLERILSRRQEMDTPEFNEQLQRIRSFFTFMAAEFPRLIARWEQQDGR
jgi:DNA-binding transcriptional regulator GbsR (MarR family)